eukprot:scaffold7963_cov116-Isochrysis_galbana.AAC.18
MRARARHAPAAMTANPLLGATTAAGEWRNGCGDSKRPWAPRRNARAMIAAEPTPSGRASGRVMLCT